MGNKEGKLEGKKVKLEDKKFSDYNLNDIAQLLKWPLIIVLVLAGGLTLLAALTELL